MEKTINMETSHWQRLRDGMLLEDSMMLLRLESLEVWFAMESFPAAKDFLETVRARILKQILESDKATSRK